MLSAVTSDKFYIIIKKISFQSG